LSALRKKAAYEDVDLSDAAARFQAREDEYAASWERSLAYLVLGDLGFGDAFAIASEVLGRLQGRGIRLRNR